MRPLADPPLAASARRRTPLVGSASAPLARARVAAAFAAGALAACSAGGSSPPLSGPGASPLPEGGAPSAGECPEGTRAEEGRCAPLVPAGECAPGTFAKLGASDCTPAGWTGACPRGFVRDATGWMCAPSASPSAPCAGATREELGAASCAPIGDCDAAFPPPEATYFVDAAYGDPQLADGKHFRAIAAAVAAAPSGVTVAIAAGRYRGSVGVLGKSLTLVGRCAARVFLEPNGEPTGGLYTNDALRVRGLTVAGFPGGVLVEGGTLELEDSVVERNSIAGVYVRFRGNATVRRSRIAGTTFTSDQLGGGVVAHEGARVIVEDSAVVDNVFASLVARGAGTQLEARGVVLARNGEVSATPQAAGVFAEDRATVTLGRALVEAPWKSGFYAASGAKIAATETLIRGARGKLAAGGGIGVLAGEGGRVELKASALVENPVLGAYADKGALVALDGVTVRGPARHADAEFGRGAQASGGELVVKNSAFVDVPQSGIGVQGGGKATLSAVLVRGAYAVPEGAANAFGGFGVLVEERSRAVLEGVTLEDGMLAALGANTGAVVDARELYARRTRVLPAAGMGAAMQIVKDADVLLERSILEANRGIAVLVSTRAKVELSGVTVRATAAAADDAPGHALTVLASEVVLGDVLFADNPGAAIGVEGRDARVHVTSGLFRGNGVALQAQHGAFVTEVDGAAPLAPGELRVAPAVRFEANGRKVGEGTLPLPSAPLD